ncbi:hypothetical protein HFO56_03135 [Rhizobium laguerreae]|uniref:hypothetical protein n=1 Tax=Rhizobium laguerreae TaxID=1076926 RepID=UPI001C90189E|nr:hypothetical protein [Rhizobium laguerreae]MBY3151381.1 hypothetical protein [Rhizobium laguerreae]
MNQIVINLVKQKLLGHLNDLEAMEHRRLKKAVNEGWAGIGEATVDRKTAVGITPQCFDDLLAPSGRRNRQAIRDLGLRKYADADAARTRKIAAMSYFANAGSSTNSAKEAQAQLAKDRTALAKAGTPNKLDLNAQLPAEYVEGTSDDTRREVVLMYHHVIDAIAAVLVDFKAEGISDDSVMSKIIQTYIAEFKALPTSRMPVMISALSAMGSDTVPARFAYYKSEIGSKVLAALETELLNRKAAEKKKSEDDRLAAEAEEKRRIKIAERQRSFDVNNGTLDLQPSFWPAPTDAEGHAILKSMKQAFAGAQKFLIGHFPEASDFDPQYICIRPVRELSWASISAIRSLLVADRFGLHRGKGQLGQMRLPAEMMLAFFWALNTDGRAEIGMRNRNGGDFKAVIHEFRQVYVRFIGDENWVSKEASKRLSGHLADTGAIGAAARWALRNADS